MEPMKLILWVDDIMTSLAGLWKGEMDPTAVKVLQCTTSSQPGWYDGWGAQIQVPGTETEDLFESNDLCNIDSIKWFCAKRTCSIFGGLGQSPSIYEKLKESCKKVPSSKFQKKSVCKKLPASISTLLKWKTHGFHLCGRSRQMRTLSSRRFRKRRNLKQSKKIMFFLCWEQFLIIVGINIKVWSWIWCIHLYTWKTQNVEPSNFFCRNGTLLVANNIGFKDPN